MTNHRSTSTAAPLDAAPAAYERLTSDQLAADIVPELNEIERQLCDIGKDYGLAFTLTIRVADDEPDYADDEPGANIHIIPADLRGAQLVVGNTYSDISKRYGRLIELGERYGLVFDLTIRRGSEDDYAPGMLIEHVPHPYLRESMWAVESARFSAEVKA